MSTLNFEQDSKFREDSKKPGQDWYSYLYGRMTNSLIEPESYKMFGENKVTFIAFNYDRSLEHFLCESLKNSFSETEEDKIISVVKEIPISHVYGKTVDLLWQNRLEGMDYLDKEDGSPYDRFGIDTLRKWCSNIQIVHEKIKLIPDAMISKIEKAQRVIFLGFGYARENLGILRINRIFRKEQDIVGTALGFSQREITDIKIALVSGFDGDPITVKIDDMDCLGVLKKYL